MLKKEPKFFNLHTLNVWRPEIKNLMVNTHEVFNGERRLYVPADLILHANIGEREYTSQELLSSLADKSICRFRFNRPREFEVVLDGHVSGAHKATPTAWVLTLQGVLGNIRSSKEEVPDVTMVCFYETGEDGCNGRGFGLIPCLPLAHLGY